MSCDVSCLFLPLHQVTSTTSACFCSFYYTISTSASRYYCYIKYFVKCYIKYLIHLLRVPSRSCSSTSNAMYIRLHFCTYSPWNWCHKVLFYWINSLTSVYLMEHRTLSEASTQTHRIRLFCIHISPETLLSIERVVDESLVLVGSGRLVSYAHLLVACMTFVSLCWNVYGALVSDALKNVGSDADIWRACFSDCSTQLTHWILLKYTGLRRSFILYTMYIVSPF